MVEHLDECPLRPFVITGVACADFTVPVITEPYAVELAAIACYVFTCGNLGMLPCLDGILLGRKPVGIITHRMKHIEAAQPLIACIDVGSYVSQRMAYMQPGSRRIREHVKHIELGLIVVNFGFIRIVFLPVLLPALFYILMSVIHYRVISRKS